MVDDNNTRKKVRLVAVLRKMSKGGSQRSALGNVSHMKYDNSCMIVNRIISALHLCVPLISRQLKTVKEQKKLDVNIARINVLKICSL